MPKSNHFHLFSQNTGFPGYTVLPYAQCQSSLYGYIPHGGTLLAKACSIVCGGLKYDEAVHLWENIIQILVGQGVYTPLQNYMHQKDVVMKYLITFAAGNHVAHTSLRNRNTLGQVGLALTGLPEPTAYLLTQPLLNTPL